MADRGYVLVRVLRPWVPDWLWDIGKRWSPLAHLLTFHDAKRCGCPCHQWGPGATYDGFSGRKIACELCDG